MSSYNKQCNIEIVLLNGALTTCFFPFLSVANGNIKVFPFAEKPSALQSILLRKTTLGKCERQPLFVALETHRKG